MIWVHDYQLMLLPRLLKKDEPSLRIGFFLHTPFPSSRHLPLSPRPRGAVGRDCSGRT